MMHKVFPPVATALILGLVGLIAWWAQAPLLAPSLGSAVFTQLLSPKEKGARPYSIAVGQVLGLVGGFGGVWIVQAYGVPEFIHGHALVSARVAAVVVAALITAGLHSACRASSPAGGATALVVAMGIESANGSGAWRMVVGILLVTALGELARMAMPQSEKTPP
jgi:uncharacterized membrane protein YeaQ/YmgE (transglycosylase-associated protein family)